MGLFEALKYWIYPDLSPVLSSFAVILYATLIVTWVLYHGIQAGERQRRRLLREIAARKRSEEALSESEASYRRLFEEIPEGLYRTDYSGKILDANPSLVAMLGYSQRERFLELKSADLFLDPADREREQRLLEQDGLVRGFEVQLRKQDGEIIWVRDTVHTVRDATGRILYYEGSLEDITDRKRLLESLSRLAIHDELTSLFNRREMTRLLRQEIQRSRRFGHPMAVALLDLDRFKEVNDRYGHQVGDEVLRWFAHLLQMNVRSVDFAARYGGDEFTLIMPETTSEEAFHLTERLRSSVAENPFHLSLENGGCLTIPITFSLGIAEFPSDAQDQVRALLKADQALYAAKYGGGNCSLTSQELQGMGMNGPKAGNGTGRFLIEPAELEEA
jgi:diguanylate cyclase (GGDEF)-like protein/PAS domain S-box-containing protein